jgi:Holliday junction resolvasome RuvABC endonuclease subunit
LIGSKNHYYDWVLENHSERHNKLLGHTKKLTQHFEQARPIAVASEAPFYNRLRPTAYEALLSTVNAVRQAVINYSYWMPLETVEPRTVKMAIGAMGNADKTMVKQALLKHDIYKHIENVDKLTEHEIDAVAVAYWRYKNAL